MIGAPTTTTTTIPVISQPTLALLLLRTGAETGPCFLGACPNHDHYLKGNEGKTNQGDGAHMSEAADQDQSDTRKGEPTAHRSQVQEEAHG